MISVLAYAPSLTHSLSKPMIIRSSVPSSWLLRNLIKFCRSLSALDRVMSDAFEQRSGFKAKIKLEPKSFERIRETGIFEESDMMGTISHFDEYGDLFGKG